MKILDTAAKKGLEFLLSMPVEQRLNYSLAFVLNIAHNRRNRLVHNMLTPLTLADDNSPKLLLWSFSVSSQKEAGNIYIGQWGSDSYFELSSNGNLWKLYDNISLDDTDRDIFALSVRGLTNEEIAYNVCKSSQAIKSRKKTIFQGMDTPCIASALTHAINKNLI